MPTSPTKSPPPGPGAPPARFEQIVVAVDGSPPAEAALDEAIAIGARFGSRVTILTVVPGPAPATSIPLGPRVPVPYSAEESAAFRTLLKEDAERARAGGIGNVSTELLEGSIVDQILGYLSEHPTDLLVVGARGSSRTSRMILGSVSTGLMHHANCTMLVHRARAA